MELIPPAPAPVPFGVRPWAPLIAHCSDDLLLWLPGLARHFTVLDNALSQLAVCVTSAPNERRWIVPVGDVCVAVRFQMGFEGSACVAELEGRRLHPLVVSLLLSGVPASVQARFQLALRSSAPITPALVADLRDSGIGAQMPEVSLDAQELRGRLRGLWVRPSSLGDSRSFRTSYVLNGVHWQV